MPPRRETPKPTEPLLALLRLVSDGKYRVTGRASNSAFVDFGWDADDVRKALLALKAKHFDKTEPRRCPPYKDMDVYKARKLMDQCDVYIHMYLAEDGTLVVDSFKSL